MYYNKENVERLRQRYPEGTRICLNRMNDDPFPVESGTLGRDPRRGRFSRYQRRIGTN